MLRYGFSHFRQAKPSVPCENTRYVRLKTDFRSMETRQFFFDTGYILVEHLMLKVNYFVESEPFNTNHHFSDGLFISKQPATKLRTYVGYIIT